MKRVFRNNCGTISFSELAIKLGVSKSTVERAVRPLKKEEKLDREGSNKSGSWKAINQQ